MRYAGCMPLALQDQLANRFHELDLATLLTWVVGFVVAVFILRFIFRLMRKFLGVAIVIVIVVLLGGGSYGYFSGLFG